MRPRLSLFAAAAVVTTPASAQSFVGEWTATAQAPDGEISEKLTVTRTADGYAIAGSDVQPPSPTGIEAGPGIDIVIDGDTFTYKRIAKAPQGDLEIVYKGTVNGDTFTGTGEIMGFIVPYNGVRERSPT